MTRLNIARILAVVLSALLLTGGIAIASGHTIQSDSELERRSHEVLAKQDTDPPEVTFENQTTDGTNVTVRSATVQEGGFVAIHNASGAVVGYSEYLGPGKYRNLTIAVRLTESTVQTQLAQMQSLLNRTQSRERMMFAMMNRTTGPGMMQNQTVRHGHMHDIVTEPDRHQLLHQMNQSMGPQMVGLVLNQTRDFRQIRGLMQSMMGNGTVNQTTMERMSRLLNRTEERETLMFQRMTNRSLSRQQMRTLMLDQTRDFARMHLLMAQLQSGQLTAQEQTLTAMVHRDTNGNEEFDFPEADDPYTVDAEPVADRARVIVRRTTQNETTGAGE